MLQFLSNVGGFNDAMLLIIQPLVLYISFLSFSLSLTNGMPVILESHATKNSNIQLYSKKQSAKLSSKINRKNSLTLDDVDVANLLAPIKQLRKLHVSFCS